VSSIPGRTLEALVTDLWLRSTPVLEAATIVALEPYREDIEYSLWAYDEETQSWRAYRNAMMDQYTAILNEVDRATPT
jgi:hypothetical protein